MNNAQKLLTFALDIAEQMVICGAEIERAEDSVRRICIAYGAKRIDVFIISSHITASILDKDGARDAQTRRIKRHCINLDKLDQLNSLSRKACEDLPSLDEVYTEFEQIKQTPPYKMVLHSLACALIAGSFVMLFGGCVSDAIVAVIIGVLLEFIIKLTEKTHVNMIIANAACSFFACLLTFFAVNISLANDPSKIIIGLIMILIPGAELTNSIRDMLSGDIMSGLLCFLESCLIAIAIAAGYIPAAFLLGGVAI